MQTETEKIFTEQLGKLPPEIIDFISSTNWDTDINEIGTLYNLSPEELKIYRREVTLTIVGLVHPDEFKDTLKQEMGMDGAFLDTIVATTEQKIFAPIRSALIAFFEEEDAKETHEEGSMPEPTNDGEVALSNEAVLQQEEPIIPGLISPPVTEPEKVWAKKPDIAPDNLPTGEVESFLPNLSPKNANLETEIRNESVPPFEEKMKRVFTAGQQSIDELAINTPEAQPVVKHPYHADPYREAIEL